MRQFTVKQKIIAGTVLAIAAVVLGYNIARSSFREMRVRIDKLSVPNEKVSLLNDLIQEISVLDQRQRAEALQKPNTPFDKFSHNASRAQEMIDTLVLVADDSTERNQYLQTEQILQRRNKIFADYIAIRKEILNSNEFTAQLDTFASILESSDLTVDSSLVYTLKKTTTTVIPDSTPSRKAEQRSKLRMLFSRKVAPQPVDSVTIKVHEELSVSVDTIAHARQNDALAEVEQILRHLQSQQSTERKRLQRRALELTETNATFISELLSILNGAKDEEIRRVLALNRDALNVMDDSMTDLSYILIGFSVAAFVLAILVWTDISKSNFYRKQLETERDRANALSEVKERFLANMSHEIRTPLQSIIGYSQQLTLGRKINAQEAANSIYYSSRHLLYIVNEILDYSRLSAGKLALNNEPFNLMTVVKEVAAALRIQSDQKQLTFILDTEKGQDYFLLGDPFRVRQILYNLLGNAIKFTEKGYVRFSVQTVDDNDRVKCRFEIKDSGIGIEPEALEHIFNPFEQTSSNIHGQHGGTGLGLTIVQALVKALNGEIKVESVPGAGSAFMVDLQFQKAVTQPFADALHGKDSQQKITPVGKVLVVDDDATILSLCSLILKQHDVTHETWLDPLAVTDAQPLEDVSHIFLDIRMPGMDGVSLCRVLRKVYPNAKFIALTAHVFREAHRDLLAQGFDAVLGKPFLEGAFLEVIGIESKQNVVSEGMDFTSLRKLTLGDEALYDSILKQFSEETRADLQLIRTVLADHADLDRLFNVVHRMAGRMAQLGFGDTAHELRDAEKLLADVREELDGTTREIQNILSRVQEGLKQ